MAETLCQPDLRPDFKAGDLEQVLNEAQACVEGGEIDPKSRLDNPGLKFDGPDTPRRLADNYRQLLEHMASERKNGARPGGDNREDRDSLHEQAQ